MQMDSSIIYHKYEVQYDTNHLVNDISPIQTQTCCWELILQSFI
jgi:hypothetical protein